MSNRKMEAELALAGLSSDTNASQRKHCLDGFTETSPSDCLNEFKNNEGENNNAAEAALKVLSDLSELNGGDRLDNNGAFWSEGEKIDIRIDLGNGNISVITGN